MVKRWIAKSTGSPFFALCLIVCTSCLSTPRVPDERDWQLYKERFITEDGRVIDTGNGNISHSEGQGYGMLLAVAYNDRQTFERLWHWTVKHLQIREDRLFAWRWTPSEHGGQVTDNNNASDGDLMIAWALSRAGTHWQEPTYTSAATAISQDIRRKLLRQVGDALVLLPGMVGFEKPDGMIVNLSYWIFPAFADLQTLDPAPEWDRLIGSGLALLTSARFGRWHLPPDWLSLQAPPAPAHEFPPMFGYNAIRIPLYLIWAKRETSQNLQPYQDFWTSFDGAKFLPPQTNVENNFVDSHDASAGIRAVAQLVATVAAQHRVQPSSFPPLEKEQDYYSASLLLLTKLAAFERAGS